MKATAKYVIGTYMTSLTCVIGLYLMIVNGILGYPVGRWEVIVWGLILLAYTYAVHRLATSVEIWRELARYQTGRVEETRPYPVITIKPEDE